MKCMLQNDLMQTEEVFHRSRGHESRVSKDRLKRIERREEQ